MAQKLQSTNRIITLPKLAPGGFRESIDPNIGKVVTLGGKLTVDFVEVGKIRTGYIIQFSELSQDEYEPIRQIYQDQFDNSELLLFSDDELNIHGKRVFLNLPADRDIKWNKSVTSGLQITLEPQDADS